MVNAYLSEAERAVLAAAKVGIVGAGGLGSNCAMHLVRAGIRKLVICDFDVVSESNLNRQFFFRDQLGKKKVEALAENLRRIEPEVKLELYDRRLEIEELKEAFKDCQAVVEAVDGAEDKATFLREMLPTGKLLVSASGMAGFGRSNEMRVKRMGSKLTMVGDGEREVTEQALPQSARVGIAAAMQANSVVAMLLGMEV